MKYAKQYDLKPADRIISPLFQTGLTKHHALYLGPDSQGIEYVAENHYLYGVRIVTAEQYFAEHPIISRMQRFTGNPLQRQACIDKAISLVGKPYDLFLYNCEHYANEVLTGKAESSQVANFAILAGLFLVGCLVASE